MNARSYHCPCCGGMISAPTDLDLFIRDMPPVRGAVLRAIAKRNGNFARVVEIVNDVWRNCPDGGPVAPRMAIAVHVSRIREDLEGTRWAIHSVHGRGYRLVTA